MHLLRMAPGRLPDSSRTAPGQLPDGSRTAPGRLPDGSRTAPGFHLNFEMEFSPSQMPYIDKINI